MLSCQLMQAFFIYASIHRSWQVKPLLPLPRGQKRSLCVWYPVIYIFTPFHPLKTTQKYDKVEPPKTNSGCKINTMYHMHTFGSLFYHSLVVKNVCVYDIRLVIYWPPSHPLKTTQKYDKVETPKTNIDHKTNIVYHLHTLGASKCMHVCGTQ